MTTSLTPDVGLALFLQEATAFGSPSSARIADAVLTLLVLRGADRRTGLPEPTPELVRQVLHQDVPVLVCVTESELPVAPAVLRALADLVRARGRLNTKRQARLLAAIDEAEPEFRLAVADPANLTWSRWYASLMRADGTPVEDPEAVLRRLDAHDRSPRADRPALPAGVERADVTGRTVFTQILLAETLLRAFARDIEHPSPAGPLLPGLPLEAVDVDPEEGLPGEMRRIAGTLMDRWTAAGLSEAFSGPYAHLAPGPEDSPHLVLADALLDQHLSYYGDSGLPVPPPPELPAPQDVRGLLLEAPLPALLSVAADGPDLVDEEVRHLAVACGLLQQDGILTTPGPSAGIWADGTPQELTELAADILATAVGRLTEDPALDREYADDVAHLLYALYERGCTADSVARKAAEYSDWLIDQAVESRPAPVPGGAPAEYTTPAPHELSDLLGIPGLDEEDRTELDAPALALAAVVDRLSATGTVFRTGDAFGLSPLGAAAVRHMLKAGAVAAPDRDTVSGWDAATLVEAARLWPQDAATRAVTDWLSARENSAGAWDELLGPLAATKPGTDESGSTRALFSWMDTATAPPEALRRLLADRALGAYALQALRARGGEADERQVPQSARAALVLDDLYACQGVDARAEPGLAPSSLVTAFDEVGATWPGGPQALIAALADADANRAHRVLAHLGERRSGHRGGRPSHRRGERPLEAAVEEDPQTLIGRVDRRRCRQESGDRYIPAAPAPAVLRHEWLPVGAAWIRPRRRCSCRPWRHCGGPVGGARGGLARPGGQQSGADQRQYEGRGGGPSSGAGGDTRGAKSGHGGTLLRSAAPGGTTKSRRYGVGVRGRRPVARGISHAVACYR
ncbi:hypothetical protein FBY35_1464 [Streptomyces sp. SLBN-118]|uniref:hypothetical protein n=1 Tax=Streptomyces sp. SLBN-118 TaxID=2768454 RepID=UPI0011512860|nr:hypothetical protein [Streptomyces sp. SLBN-118]TQK51076.1 hypothetical protein FBY35_1464 [Streptomyces sp. SLBN-118]